MNGVLSALERKLSGIESAVSERRLTFAEMLRSISGMREICSEMRATVSRL